MTNLSMTLEIVFRLEIGRKLHGLARFRPGFFRSGSTCAVLNSVGNVPSANERFMRWAISGANTSAHDFNSGVGRTSRGEDLLGNEHNSFSTSADVTSVKATSGEPTYSLGVWNRLLFTVRVI